MSFEPVGKANGSKITLDLDLWQSKRKIMKGATTLRIANRYTLGDLNGGVAT